MLPVARAYLISFLATQHAVNAERFASRFPTPWLVWEAGDWVAPTKSTNATIVAAPRPTRPGKGGDALCFEVALEPGGYLIAGRNPQVPLVVNDATFSREQLLVARPDASRYTVALVPKAQAATHNGAPLTAQPRDLAEGDTIVAGSVTLRFHAPAGFASRLAAFGLT